MRSRGVTERLVHIDVDVFILRMRMLLCVSKFAAVDHLPDYLFFVSGSVFWWGTRIFLNVAFLAVALC